MVFYAGGMTFRVFRILTLLFFLLSWIPCGAAVQAQAQTGLASKDVLVLHAFE